jgi:hypothetical protein
MESSLEVPQKTKNRITIWSSTTTPGHISEGSKSGDNKDTYAPMFLEAIVTIAKLWK